MLTQFLGSSTFAKGLNIYLNKHQYQNTVTDNLWESIQRSANENRSKTDVEVDIKKMMDTWTLQTGYPVIDVQIQSTGNDNNNNAQLLLSQSRFLLDSSSTSPSPSTATTSGESPQWIVPIGITTQDQPQNPVFYLLDQPRKPLPISPLTNGWIKLNGLQSGVYQYVDFVRLFVCWIVSFILSLAYPLFGTPILYLLILLAFDILKICSPVFAQPFPNNNYLPLIELESKWTTTRWQR